MFHMIKKINPLDYVRVIAVFMILVCHYCLFSNLNNGVGRYLAGTGNMLFFLVSALLYGIKYRMDCQIMDNRQFVFNRIVKLGASVWPYLIILIALYLVFGIRFSWISAGLNFVFLGYLGILPGNGHLWFLTVLMACYLEIMLLQKLKADNRYIPWVILVVSIFLVLVGERIGIPSGAFLTLGLFGFVFLRSEWFLQKTRSMKFWMAIIIVAFNSACFFIEYNGLFEKSRSLHFLLTGLCGITLLSLLLRYIPDKSNKVVSFLCGISFEIYIVHHTLCAGPFIRITQWPFGHVLNFCIIVVLSIVLALLLRFMAKGLRSILKVKG